MSTPAMQPLTIASQWESFEQRVIDPNAPPVQRTEMQMAFYAGVHVMQCIQMAIASLPDSEALRVLSRLQHEMDQYAKLFSAPTTTPN